MNSHYDTVLCNLTGLVSSGMPGSFVVFVVDAMKNYYVQFFYDPESSSLNGETVGNNFIPPAFRLQHQQLKWLEAKGWSVMQSGSFGRQWNIRRDQSLHPVAVEIAELFPAVFGVHENAPLTVETEKDGVKESILTIPCDGLVSISDERPLLPGEARGYETICPGCYAPRSGNDAFCSQCGKRF